MSIDKEFLHDLSSPLSALRMHLELLIEKAKCAKGQSDLLTLQKCQSLLDKCVDKLQDKKNSLQQK